MANPHKGQLYSMTQRKLIDPSPNIKSFLASYRTLCIVHGVAFSHEDSHGSFVIAPINDELLEWACSPSLAEGVEHAK